MQGYKSNLDEENCNTARDIIMAIRHEHIAPELYWAYAYIFFEASSESMHSYDLPDLAIELLNSKWLLRGLFYNLSEKELDILS